MSRRARQQRSSPKTAPVRSVSAQAFPPTPADSKPAQAPLLPGTSPYPRAFLVAMHLLALASFVYIFAASPPTREILTRPSSVERIQYVDDLNGDVSKLTKSFRIGGEFSVVNHGLALLPGEAATLTYEGTKPPEESPFMRLWVPFADVAPTTISLTVGKVTESLYIDKSVSAGVLRPSDPELGTTTFTIFIECAVPQNLGNPAVVLDRIEIGTQILNNGFLDTPIALRGVAILWPYALLVLATSLALRTRRRVALWWSGGAALAAALAVLLYMTQPQLAAVKTLETRMLFLASVWTLVIGGAAALLWPRTRDTWGLRSLTMGAAVFACFNFRWSIASIASLSTPQPDTMTYLMLAETMKHPFDTQFREPLFIWVAWLTRNILSAGAMPLQFVTFLLGLFVMVPLYAVARLLVPPVVAVGVCLAYGFNPGLATNSALGLREELLPLAILSVLWAIITLLRRSEKRAESPATEDAKSPWLRVHGPTLALVAAGAACFMTRLNMFVFLGAFLVVMLGLRRPQWRRWALVAVAWAALMTPQLIASKRQFGDAFHSINFAGSYFRNLEFADKPGFLTRQQVNENPYAGPPITMGQYVFGMHTFGDVVATHARGLWMMVNESMASQRLMRLERSATADDRLNVLTRTEPPKWYERALYGLFLMGFVAAWFVPQGWTILLAWFLVQAPLAFVFGKNLADERLLYNGVPLMLLMAGMAATVLAQRAARMRDTLRTAAE